MSNGSITRAAGLAARVTLLCVAGAAWAQEEPATITQPAPMSTPAPEATEAIQSFVVLDPERLYLESQFGKRVQADLNNLAREIQEENGKLTRDLEAEELALLDQRALLTPDEFREIADAFDEKVQSIRDAQDRKGQELNAMAARGRQSFNEASLPVLQTILKERNALGILDSRVIFLPAAEIDITDDAIERVDQVLGDGTP
ncbi:OmpH family outer membrane protein [Falsihalocynthiibacter sp. SS001]|uniref:OmpH family outer membrane protein n=1 Tax=Falsihalocynthiibacter sp. SS001 TaxID=3349698 RepID=UPI0036D2E176